MAKTTLRIPLPTNVEEQLKLGNLIFEKHQKDGTTSVLNAMQDYKWDEVGPNLKPALEKHLLAEQLSRDMEQAYKDRDAMMGDVESVLQSTRDFLKGAYSKQPKKLGEYGYTVDDTPKAKPAKKAPKS